MDCNGIPHSLLLQEFPHLLPVQILWWISQVSKTKLVLAPILSSTACLQLHLPFKLHAIPLSPPRPIYLRLVWNCPTHPCPEKNQPCPTVRCTSKGTVKHSNRSPRGPSPRGISPWPCSWHSWTHELLLTEALQAAYTEPELAPHGSEKNMLLMLKPSWAFISWSNLRCPNIDYVYAWAHEGCTAAHTPCCYQGVTSLCSSTLKLFSIAGT